jgi:peptidoglycan endopeptidase LytE
MWVFKKFSVLLPHQSESQFNLARNKNSRRIWKRANLKPGDLVFHKTTSARVGHAGMYVGHGKFISSTSSSGVRIDSLYDSYWGPRWVGGTRLPYTIATSRH